MKPILEELYYGRIYPFEQIVPQDPGYRPLGQKKSDIQKMLEEKLPAEDVQALEELLDLGCDGGVMETYASFEYGVKYCYLFDEPNIVFLINFKSLFRQPQIE
jgi:hypothetical protein